MKTPTTHGPGGDSPIRGRLFFAGGLTLVLAGVVAGLLLMASDTRGGATISEGAAIAAAVAQVEADGIMELAGRDTVAEEENGNWHVFFPISIFDSVVFADADCSNATNSIDALSVLLKIANLPVNQAQGCPAIGSQTFAGLWGDADCSGEVNSLDALAILLNVANLPVNQAQGCAEIGSLVDEDDSEDAQCEEIGCANVPRGGEPHVIVDGDDATIVEVYYTQ